MANQQEAGDSLRQNIKTNLALNGRPARLHQVIAEEVGTSKAYTDVNHIQPEKWVLPWLMLTGYAFCQALKRGIEGKDWEEMCDSYKVMSKAVGVKKPQEAQKAKSLVGHESRQEEQNAIGTVGGASQGSHCRAGHGTEVR